MIITIVGQPPRTTSQQKGERIYGNKIIHYEKSKVTTAKEWFKAGLVSYRPVKPLEGAIKLYTIWVYKGRKEDWKTTKPDTDNMIKMLKDVMQDMGFFKNDSQVCSELTLKAWGSEPGLIIKVEEMEEKVDAYKHLFR